jgi:hypothetical protein
LERLKSVLDHNDEMPEHNTGAAKKKAPSAGGGGKRSAGGQKLGRKAARAAVKSDEAVERLLALLEGQGSVSATLNLGRVERVYGGFYDVRLLDGTVGRLGLGGNIRGGRGGCFIALNDFVVVDGGALKGKLSLAEADRAKDAVAAARIRVKKGFFAVATEEGEMRDEDDLFDRSDDRRAEELARAARKAAAAAEAERKALLPGRRAVAPLAAVAEELAAPVRVAAVAEEESDDEEDGEEAPAATGAGGEIVRKPAPSGMNRAQRRAAAQAAAELEEARQAFLRSKAEEEEFQRQLATGDLGGAEWVDDDEVDVDAI